MDSDTTCPAVRRIAVLTGGGDCPGLNAVIRAVGRDALNCGIEVVGVEDGFLGLIEGRTRKLTEQDLTGLINRGGTILGSNNKANPARWAAGRNPDGSIIFKDVRQQCFETLKRNEVGAMVVIGGDGTLTIANDFHNLGIPIVGVPKTIDNDIEGTDVTFGFETAVATATDSLDRVRTTADSHHRAMVVELMGRNAGWITLHSGVAGAADVILLPEMPFSMERVFEVVRRRSEKGKHATLIAVAEGCRPVGGQQMVAKVDHTSADPIRLGGIAKYIADEVEKATGVESRYCVLGHTQRGGIPVASDRVLSTLLGSHAMTLLREGKTGRMVAVQQGRLTSVPLESLAGKQRLVNLDNALILAARRVGASFCEG
ncbi:MAG: 6-phosphofructokinase [Phycisphaerales bacterium]